MNSGNNKSNVVEMPKKSVLTYSSWNMFRNCPRAYENRYVKHLVPKKEAEELWFGSLIHKCLEIWFTESNGTKAERASQLFTFLDNKFPHRDEFEPNGTPNPFYSEEDKLNWMKATAMMNGYINRYPEEPFEVVAVEKNFCSDIFNPRTNALSKSFKIAGKIDAIVRMKDTGALFIMEHKTASTINEEYLQKLPMDTQISLYNVFGEIKIQEPIAGVIYDVLEKTAIRPKSGETEEEYQQRYLEACAKNKNGKSNLKRKMPETDEEFQARLAEKYCTPDTTAYHREMLYISDDLKEALQVNLWDFTQHLLFTRRQRYFPQNQSYCFNYHRACDYYALCRSNDNPEVIENQYLYKRPHSELDEEELKTEQVKDFPGLPEITCGSPCSPPITPELTGLSREEIIQELLLAS